MMTKLPSVAALALALCACDPRIFDDLADEAPVNTHGEPVGLDANFYGEQIAGSGASALDGGAFFVLARNADGLGHVTVSAAGRVEAVGVEASALEVGGAVDTFDRDFLMVGDPASATVAMGVSADGGALNVVHLVSTDDREQLGTFPFAGGRVEGIAFGTTNIDPASAGDIAMAGGTRLGVITNFAAAPVSDECTHDREAAFRAVLADLDLTIDGQELAVALGDADRATSPAQIVITDGATIAAGAAAPDGACFSAVAPLLVIDAPGGEPDFGAEMLVADFDDSGRPDLAVSAPSAQKVYVFFDLDVAAGVPTPVEVTVAGATPSFGTALAAGDLNGDGQDELIVGEPDASPADTSLAGSAHIFELGGGDFGVLHTVHDAQPEANQRFGEAVTVVPFGDAENILVVGADREVFTYFRTPATGDEDVRARE